MKIIKDDKTALVFNASHIAAQAVLEQLIEHESYERILVFDEEKIEFKHPKITFFPFQAERLEKQIEGNDLYCFYDIKQAKKNVSDVKIKNLYSFQIAKIAAMNGVNQCLLLSSVSSSKTSMNFNARIRASLEESINALPFWAVHTFRPSAIVNTENQSRWGEQIANRLGRGLDRVTGGLVSKYRPVEASLIAKTMIDAAQELEEGRFLYPTAYFSDADDEEQGLSKQ
ncbi:MAG: hypothetical protein AAGG68_07660 [Bacteroidota bacterium]